MTMCCIACRFTSTCLSRCPQCEGDPEEEHEGEELEEEEFVGSDFLQSDEDVELSDSDFEIDPDTMSIQSTPKPILQ